MKPILQYAKPFGITEVSANVVNATCKFVPGVSVSRKVTEFTHLVPHEFTIRLAGVVRPGKADHSKVIGNPLAICKFKQRRNQLTLGQIACAAEYDNARACHGHPSVFLTLCPPNWFRIAASNLAPYGESCLDLKRA